MLRKLTQCVLAAGLGLYMPVAAAAGIFWAVDDATTLDPRSCHVEVWAGGNGGAEYALASACTDARGIEWMAAAEFEGVSLELAAKSVVAEWGDSALALYGSTTAVRGAGLDVHTVNVPFSAWVAPEWTLHANLGWQHHGRHALTWGLGVDRALSDTHHLIAELHGDDRDAAELQGGIRTLFGRGAVDAALARRLRDGNDWRLTVGAVVEF